MNFFHLKVKCQPEDFRVDEITSIPLSSHGDFVVYKLIKRGWNTVDALRQIAKHFQLPLHRFAYGGKKDRYGLTSQMISIQETKIRSFRDKNYQLEFLGFSSQPMGPHYIAGNRFRITVRRLPVVALARAEAQIPLVQSQGYFNYFDDQRFGSYDFRRGFLGEYLLKQQWNDALHTYLTSIHPEAKRPEKDRKQFFAEHWNQWQACRAQAVTGFEKIVFDFLVKQPHDFITPVKRIPQEDLAMAISAFQSHLWNEWLRRLLAAKQWLPCVFYHGSAGDYLFYNSLPQVDYAQLQDLELPTLGPKMVIPNPFCAQLHANLLKDFKIDPAWLNEQLSEASFKPTPRPVVVIPAEMTYSIHEDELYPGFKKLSLAFRLPRAAYATLLVKRLFVEQGKHSKYPFSDFSEV